MSGVMERTLSILELLAQQGEGLELGEIAQRLNIPRSGVHRLLADLVAAGYVRQLRDHGAYTLTMLAASIGDVQHYSDVVFHDWQDHLATVSVVPRQQFPLSDMVEPPQSVTVTAQAPWVIIDDFFPHLLTGFRVAEFNAHLQAFDQLQIMSSQVEFAEQYSRYSSLYPELAGRISTYAPERLAGVELASRFRGRAFVDDRYVQASTNQARPKQG